MNDRRAVHVRSELFHAAVACGAVFGQTEASVSPLNEEHKLANVLQAAGVADSGEARPLAAWLLDLYPGGRLPLDPVADYVIATHLTDDAYNLAFDSQDHDRLTNSSAVLARAAGYRQVRSACRTPATEAVILLASSAASHDGWWAGPPFRSAMQTLDDVPPDVRVTLRTMPLALPLAEAAVDFEQREVQIARQQAAQNPACRPDLAAAERTLAALKGDSEDEVGETASPN